MKPDAAEFNRDEKATSGDGRPVASLENQGSSFSLGGKQFGSVDGPENIEDICRLVGWKVIDSKKKHSWVPNELMMVETKVQTQNMFAGLEREESYD